MVYVDSMAAPLGRMLMCHMLADSREELDQMADKIGVKRQWIQHAGTPYEHYDICRSKRVLAVKAGAAEVDTRGLVKIIQKKRSKSIRAAV